MLKDKAIRNKLLGVLGFIIVLQASLIGWSLMSPVAAFKVPQPKDFIKLAGHFEYPIAYDVLCDPERGNLLYVSVLVGEPRSHHLVVVENGCPKKPKGT